MWNAHNSVLGEEALLIYIVPVCYVKQVRIERPSNIIISLHWNDIYISRLEDCGLQCTDPNKMYEFKRDILLNVLNVHMAT